MARSALTASASSIAKRAKPIAPINALIP
jgi:hypothetical protein